MFVLFYSRLGHRIDGRESGDQVQMRSFMPRLQKLKYLCPAAAAAAAADGSREGREGEGNQVEPTTASQPASQPAICLGFLANDLDPLNAFI